MPRIVECVPNFSEGRNKEVRFLPEQVANEVFYKGEIKIRLQRNWIKVHDLGECDKSYLD